MARISEAVDAAAEDEAWVDKDSAPGWWAIRPGLLERTVGRERGARRVLAESGRLQRGQDGAYSVVRRHNGKPVRVYVVLLDPGAEQAHRQALSQQLHVCDWKQVALRRACPSLPGKGQARTGIRWGRGG